MQLGLPWPSFERHGGSRLRLTRAHAGTKPMNERLDTPPAEFAPYCPRSLHTPGYAASGDVEGHRDRVKDSRSAQLAGATCGAGRIDLTECRGWSTEIKLLVKLHLSELKLQSHDKRDHSLAA